MFLQHHRIMLAALDRITSIAALPHAQHTQQSHSHSARAASPFVAHPPPHDEHSHSHAHAHLHPHSGPVILSTTTLPLSTPVLGPIKTPHVKMAIETQREDAYVQTETGTDADTDGKQLELHRIAQECVSLSAFVSVSCSCVRLSRRAQLAEVVRVKDQMLWFLLEERKRHKALVCACLFAFV